MPRAAVNAPIATLRSTLKGCTMLNGSSMLIHSFTDSFRVVVPEPSTIALVSLGLLGFVVQALSHRPMMRK